MTAPSGVNGEAGISMAQMQRHLDGTFIGYRPGDPTAALPPATMPRPAVPPPPLLKTINLAAMSQAELSAAAAATLKRDCFAVLLPNQPGVPVDRLAYVTGQAPSRPDGQQQQPQEQQQQQQQQQQQTQQKVQPPAPAVAPAALAAPRPALAGPAANGLGAPPAPSRPHLSQPPSDSEIVAVLSRYLKRRPSSQEDSSPVPGCQEAISWEELGLAKGGPRMGGVECDLQRLWDLVYMERGGYDAVSSPLGWSEVAQEMGANLKTTRNAGYLVNQWYRRFLLPLERHLEKSDS